MKKIGLTAVLLASLGLLAACEQEPEDKMESAMESMSDAAEETGEAIELEAREATGNERTMGEKMEDGMEDAGEEMGEAYDDAVN